MLRGLIVWSALCAMFMTLDVLGLADELSLPVPLILVLVGARALAEVGGGRRFRGLAIAGSMGAAALGALVWGTMLGLGPLPPRQTVTAGLAVAGLALLLGNRAVRGTVLRRLGLDPASPVHVVTVVAMAGTLAGSVMLFLELRAEPSATVPLYATDSIVSVAGDVALALAGVGFLLTRDLRETAARLGLRPLSLRQLGWAALAALALHAMVGGLEWAESVLFPALYALEDRFEYEFVGVPPVVGALLLSLAAGMGEEVLFRGALQPRVGVVVAAALFAVLHVQYQLPGILIIFLVGLALGGLRDRMSTTFAAVVHALYDLGAFVLDLA